MQLQNREEKDLPRTSTLWDSREALEQIRKNAKVPFPVQIFKIHGAEPNVRIFEVPYAYEP